MISLIPYKKLRFESNLSPLEFEDKLCEHLKFSMTKIVLTSLTTDFLIKGQVKGNRFRIYRRNPFSFINIKILGKIEDAIHGTTISVTILPTNSWIIFRAIGLIALIMLLSLMHSTVLFIVILLSFYLLVIIPFRFDVWWVDDLFNKVLL